MKLSKCCHYKVDSEIDKEEECPFCKGEGIQIESLNGEDSIVEDCEYCKGAGIFNGF